ncbi:MAG TPA: hypothetical protein VKB38_06130 [Terracidiphilus sp.]|nr:hypothetical protein [Terracidiphilus sp.]
MTRSPSNSKLRAAFLLLAFCPAAGQPQLAAQSSQPQTPAAEPAPPPATQQPSPQPAQAPPAEAPQQPAAPAKKTKLPTSADRRHAAKLYLEAATLYKNEQFEQALDLDLQAATLDPSNPDYKMAAEVARSHAVTVLMQASAQDRLHGDTEKARAALARALELDPQNAMVLEHMRELDGQAGRIADELDSGMKAPEFASPIELSPNPDVKSFHLHTSQRLLIEQVFKAYGIEATLDDSVRSNPTRMDVDDVTFPEAVRILDMLTTSFYVPIDPRKVLVARDTRALRSQYMRNAVETVDLPGLDQTGITDMGNIARNVFQVQQAAVDASSGTITLRAPETTLHAFNATYSDLMEGRPEVLLEVRMLQLAHNNATNIGVELPQTITAFNVYAEEQAILNQNASLVQQIIASGLAKPGDILTILGILLASGVVSNPIFSNGFVLFGGGLTLSGLTSGPLTVNLNLNSSDSRELDDFQLRLEDNEEGTLKSGSRYPIMTSSYSSLGSGLGVGGINIPGLNLPGTSGSLGSLLNQVNTVPNIPQVQYEDLGLVLKARPRVLRSGDVAINVDLKITALAGSALNNVPILANRSYTGAVTLPANTALVLAAEVDKNESTAISGVPGMSEIPGLTNTTNKNTQKNYSTLLILITPHVVRSPHGLGHGPLLRVDRDASAR